jgi:hypothetical protein
MLTLEVEISIWHKCSTALRRQLYADMSALLYDDPVYASYKLVLLPTARDIQVVTWTTRVGEHGTVAHMLECLTPVLAPFEHVSVSLVHIDAEPGGRRVWPLVDR